MTTGFGKGYTKALLSTLTLATAFCYQAYASSQTPIYLNGHWYQTEQKENITFQNSLLALPSTTNLKSIVTKFISDNSSLIGLNAQTQYKNAEEVYGSYLNSIRLTKTHRGIEVLGGEGVVHLDGNNIAFANLDGTKLDSVVTAAAINPEQAEAIAYSAYQSRAASNDSAELKVLILPAGSKNAGQARLAYKVTVRSVDGLSSDTHFIDAQNGSELLAFSNVQTAKKRVIYAGEGTDDDFDFEVSRYKLAFDDADCKTKTGVSSQQSGRLTLSRRPVEKFDLGSEACTSGLAENVVKAAKDALANSGKVYDYYFARHGRKSIDNADSPLTSVVNFGSEWANAAWLQEKKLMLYGAGDGQTLNDFSIALDVAAHELTHGLTGSTAKLVYSAEPGALNESYSDMFGKIVAFNGGSSVTDWKLGRELFKDGEGFVRDLANPDIAHYKDMLYKGDICHRFNDMCGVHDNSGIPNKAGSTITNALGLEKAGKIFYLTLTQLLRPNSSFKEAAEQAVKACQKVLGAQSTDCTVVTEAYKSVGVL